MHIIQLAIIGMVTGFYSTPSPPRCTNNGKNTDLFVRIVSIKPPQSPWFGYFDAELRGLIRASNHRIINNIQKKRKCPRIFLSVSVARSEKSKLFGANRCTKIAQWDSFLTIIIKKKLISLSSLTIFFLFFVVMDFFLAQRRENIYLDIWYMCNFSILEHPNTLNRNLIVFILWCLRVGNFFW